MRFRIVALGCMIAATALPLASAFAQEASPTRYPRAQFGSIPRIDQRDPRYQQSYEHMARAADLLRKAAREAQRSNAAYPLPGFRYDLLANDLRYLAGQLQPVLAPERRRLRYERLTPDSAYFTPRADHVRDADD